MGDWFEGEELRKREYFNGTMTHCQQTVSHGGSVRAVLAQAIQNMPTNQPRRQGLLILPFSMEAAVLTACSVRTGITGS